MTPAPERSLWPSMTSVLSNPSVRSIRCSDARSIWVYDRVAPTSSEIRRVEDFSSESRVRTVNVPATHSSPGSSEASAKTLETRWHQATFTPAAASAGAINQS